jgi:lysophospholipase L1-like esterase
MSAPDRSWTIAPTLVWFSVALSVGLIVIDGDVAALADRLTSKREKQVGGAGPTFTASMNPAPGDDSDVVAKLPPPPAGSHDIDALDDVCIEGTDQACKRWAMDAFYRSVADAKAGKLGRALRVSWYGDSVVATDALPGGLRTRLQGELGDGGPGFVFALAPHRFCHHNGITRSGGDNWLSHAISMAHTSDGFYGPGGASVETNSGRMALKLVAGKVTRAELYYLAQPSGGTATVTADGVEIMRAVTAAEAKAPAWASGTAEKGASKFEIKGDGKTRVFGISLENASGAVVDNLGIVSVHVKSFAAHNEVHYTAELGHRSADLLMIMIGANEAQWLHAGKAMKDYQAHYEKLLATMRKGRPNGSCLVVSPTDQAEAKDGGFASKPVIAHIVAAQRAAAHAQGCAFYSTYDWMGGKGSAAKWFKRHYVNSDFIHLSKAGAEKMADALFGALMKGAKQHASK